VVTVTERVGIRELRDHLTETIRRVRAGESFEVTYDGEPVALLTPAPKSRLELLIGTGEVIAAQRPFTPPKARLERVRTMTTDEAIAEDRGD
jgi:prevent-host-death family protein